LQHKPLDRLHVSPDSLRQPLVPEDESKHFIAVKTCNPLAHRFLKGMKPCPRQVSRFFAVSLLILAGLPASAVIRDGGIDPANLGKGDWIFSMRDVTNKLGGHISSVTNENSLMLYYKSIGVRYMIVKTATSDTLYNGCYAGPQFTSNLVNIAHANGIWIFGYNRSYGANIPAEIGIADYVFNQGADGFVFDAEAEWESGNAWITNGPAQAWQLCSAVRSNWPNKFLGHAPFPVIYFHSSFPYKEFGFWCDAVMPQIYHFSTTGIKGSPSAAINWNDANFAYWQNTLYSLPIGNSNGVIVNWTNAIKPITPLRDVYGTTSAANLICNGTAPVDEDRDVMEFIDYSQADPNAQTAGGYQGVNFWRADLHGTGQFANIKAGTLGAFPGVVNNVVLDDARAALVGSWAHVLVFNVTNRTAPGYIGATGTDTNSFGTNYFSKTQGSGSAYMQFTPNVAVPGDYDVYQWHPYVTNASSGTPFEIKHVFGTNTVFANQRTNDGNWSLLGRHTFAVGTNGYIRVRDDFADAGNLAIVDGLKLIFIATNATVPFISQPPTNQTAIAGQGVTLAASAVGVAPLAYQWRFNGANSVNATNNAYVIAGAQTNNAGAYTLVVTNSFGAVTSAVATLTVNYSLTTSVVGGGSISPGIIPSGYPPGAAVLLTAAPNPGYDFFGWAGDATGPINPLNLVMAMNKSVTATFLNTNTDLILDNTNAEVSFTASWSAGTSSADKYLGDYRFASTAAGGALTATFRPAFANAGYYDVFIWYPQGSNRATNAPWSVFFDGGSTNVAVDQTGNGGGWRLLATARPFSAGTNGFVRLANDTGYSGKVVLADAVRFLYVEPLNVAPVVTQPPQSQMVKAGSNVLFMVSATGVPAPAYQWRFFGSNLPGQTASNYTRFNAQLADTGNYSVLVSNVAGSVPSSNALLKVNPWLPVVFQSVNALPDGRMHLVISGNAGESLWVDRTTNLPPAWLPLTNFFITNGTVQFSDSTATNSPRGFYRARQ